MTDRAMVNELSPCWRPQSLFLFICHHLFYLPQKRKTGVSERGRHSKRGRSYQ